VNTITYDDKIKRLRRQLSLSENRLRQHPAVKHKLILLQNLLNRFNLQMQWKLAGPTARLFMIFQASLQGEESAKSKTGFIGPALQKMQDLVAYIMEASLSPSEKAVVPLLLNFTQLFAIILMALVTQLDEDGKRLFSQHEPAMAKEAQHLLT